MKVKYSRIVGVESNESGVTVMFRPAGSDESDRPETISITPHDDRMYLTFSFGNRALEVKPGMIGANHAEINYVPRNYSL